MHPQGWGQDPWASFLREAGFPDGALALISERILSKPERGRVFKKKDDGTRKRIVGTPYVHWISRHLKKVGVRCRVNVIFTSKNTLGRVCKVVHNKLEYGDDSLRSGRMVAQSKRAVEYNMEVVYHVLLSCGKKCIGQTDRCSNKWLSEHHRYLTGQPCLALQRLQRMFPSFR